jgi:Sulfotransferase family
VKAPVFVLAPPRSFSTAAVAVLAGHPALFGFPEMLMFSGNTVSDVLDTGVHKSGSARGAAARRSGIYRAIAQIEFGGQGENEIAAAATWLDTRRRWDSVQLLRYLFDAVDPLIGMEKSPETSMPENLPRCLEQFPGARFVHLTREPGDSMRSMREHWRFRLAGKSDAAVVATVASVWYLVHKTIVETLAQLPPHRWIRVRGEDLLTDPATHATGVFSWLGLATDDAVRAAVRHPERWVFAGTGSHDHLFGGDPKFMRNPRLRRVGPPDPMAFPSDWQLLPEMTRRIMTLAESLGYR